MRRPVFRRWIRGELFRLSGLETFSLRKIIALAQGENPRLKEPLLLYAHAEKKTDLVCGLLWSGKLKDEYRCVSAALESVDWADVGSLGEARENLPREYAKFVDSFLAAYAEPESRAASKRLRWQRSREEQLRKGVSTTEICRALGLNIGNVNAYLKDGALDKVSLSNATKIMKHLMAL